MTLGLGSSRYCGAMAYSVEDFSGYSFPANRLNHDDSLETLNYGALGKYCCVVLGPESKNGLERGPFSWCQSIVQKIEFGRVTTR